MCVYIYIYIYIYGYRCLPKHTPSVRAFALFALRLGGRRANKTNLFIANKANLFICPATRWKKDKFIYRSSPPDSVLPRLLSSHESSSPEDLYACTRAHRRDGDTYLMRVVI